MKFFTSWKYLVSASWNKLEKSHTLFFFAVLKCYYNWKKCIIKKKCLVFVSGTTILKLLVSLSTEFLESPSLTNLAVLAKKYGLRQPTGCICWVCFLIFCFRSFSSSFRSSCSLSENLSQSYWIVEWIQVKYHLFLCAFTFHFFLHFIKSKVYLSLTDLVVTFKFISSREFSTIAISSYNCPRLTLPC